MQNRDGLARIDYLHFKCSLPSLTGEIVRTMKRPFLVNPSLVQKGRIWTDRRSNADYVVSPTHERSHSWFLWKTLSDTWMILLRPAAFCHPILSIPPSISCLIKPDSAVKLYSRYWIFPLRPPEKNNQQLIDSTSTVAGSISHEQSFGLPLPLPPPNTIALCANFSFA